MRHALLLSSLLLLTAPLGACSDDSGNTPTPDGAVGDGAVGDGAVGDGPSTPGDAGAPDTRTLPDAQSALVEVSGGVSEGASGDKDVPVANARVYLHGFAPPVETTSGSDGRYVLEVPAGELVFFGVQVAGYLDHLEGVRVPAAGASDVRFEILPKTLIDDVTKQAGLPALDPKKGVVLVMFEKDAPSGDETASLSLSHGGSFAIEAGGKGVKSATLVKGGEIVLGFVNVEPGQLVVTPSTPSDTCNFVLGAGVKYPVVAGADTWVKLSCPTP